MSRKTSTTVVDAENRPEDQKMPIGSAFTYGLQHVLTMYGGIIAPPLIIGSAAGVSQTNIGILVACCLFIGGLATLLQTVGVPFFGSKLPLVQGVSFAGVATMLAIVNQGDGIQGVFGSILVASLIGLVVAPFFAQIIRFFPPVVTGVVITTIGLSLLPVAAGWIVGVDPKAPDYASPVNVLLAVITLFFIILFSKVGNAALSRLSILLSLVIGTVVAALMGQADFSNVFNGDIFAVPQPFLFGLPTFPIAGIISMIIVILVTMTETTADILAIGEIVGTKIDRKRIANGLRADMLSSAVAPVFNTFTQTAFAQNVGLVAITKIKSRWAVAAGGVVLIVLGLFPVLGRLVAAIPGGVLGGAGIVLFGTVAASGIRTLSRVKYEDNMNLIIVATSIGFGILPEVNPAIYSNFPSWFQVIFNSSISSAAIMAIFLNLVFNVWVKGNRHDASVFAAAPLRAISTSTIRTLRDGDRYADGKLIDGEGKEVPVVDDEPSSSH